MPINPVLNGAANLGAVQVSVGTTVSPVVPARSTRRGVILQNLTGSDAVYLGTESGVSTTQGYPIQPTLYASLYIPTTAAIYGIVKTTTQTVGVLEVYD